MLENKSTKCNTVQLEKFYSELSQPVASDIDFEYFLIFMVITIMKMMTLIKDVNNEIIKIRCEYNVMEKRICSDYLHLFLRGEYIEAKSIFKDTSGQALSTNPVFRRETLIFFSKVSMPHGESFSFFKQEALFFPTARGPVCCGGQG